MRIVASCLLAFLGIVALASSNAGDGVSTSSAAGQLDLIERVIKRDPKLLVLDVRTAEEFAASHIVGATNVAHDQLEARNSVLPADKHAEILVYCRSGRRSALALVVLERLGYSRVYHLDGDFLGWQAAGRAVEMATH